MLPVWIIGPRAQSLSNDISRRTQQDDVVELRKEFPHILRASAQEQHIGILGGQEVLHAVLSPHPVSVHFHRRRVASDLHPLGELVTVGIHGLISACSKLADDRGLAGSRHPRQKNSLHDDIPSAVERMVQQPRTSYEGGKMYMWEFHATKT